MENGCDAFGRPGCADDRQQRHAAFPGSSSRSMHLGAALFFYPRPLISRARRQWRPRRVRLPGVRDVAGSTPAGSAESSTSGWARTALR